MRLVDRAARPYPTLPQRPLVLGHRGSSAVAPENTLESFEQARRDGADGVELDAMVCGSGEVVVCHDPWLDRLADVLASVHQLPLSTLRRFNVAAHFRSWRGPARIPTLDEVLGDLPDLLVNIELKEERLRDAGLAGKVAALVQRHHAEARVVISSFNPLELMRMRAVSPRLPLAFLYELEAPRWAKGGRPAALVGAQAVHPQHDLLDDVAVSRWHHAGFRVAAWTVNDPVRAAQLADSGVDAIISNRPAGVLAAVQRVQQIRR